MMTSSRDFRADSFVHVRDVELSYTLISGSLPASFTVLTKLT